MTPDLAEIFPKGLTGVVFDCDGVMIDSLAANREFYNRVLASLGLGPMRKEQEDYAFRATSLQALQAMIPKAMHGRIEQAVRNDVNYEREILPLIKLMPGFVSFSESLHAAGLRQAIDTNRTDIGTQRVLDFFNLPPYFDPVISASIVPPKPDPAGLEMICQAWKALPCQVLFVGDSSSDFAAARDSGCKFAAFGSNFYGADLSARDFSELGKLLAQLTLREKG